MKLLVTQIEFDFDDCYDEELSKDDKLRRCVSELDPLTK